MSHHALIPSPAPVEADCRCVCGSLVARMVPGGVELKCRRCKRTLIVPVSDRSRVRPASTIRGQRP
jgi:hypothetical protein